MPWSPPIMLVSIVGHASFHTAAPNGPSMMDRSYFRRAGTAAGAFASVTPGFTTGADASVMLIGLGVEAVILFCRTSPSQFDNSADFSRVRPETRWGFIHGSAGLPTPR